MTANYFEFKPGRGKKYSLVVRSGKYKGTELKIQKIKVGKDLPDGSAILTIEYDVIQNPVGIQLTGTAVEKNLGKFIIQAIKNMADSEALDQAIKAK